ncbi:DUF255 domain-containing protein [Bacillus subtilis]|uniref:DUF255 domain-containing protein n=1 Tax=Bacillus subtilis TaxID=1423 RepID=UPI0023681916|nr:DUF255 domain-containing protein [Bacillus subtilis]WDI25625.1 DUF255 domain-containing protein [Bacillus subtilis]
MPNKSKPNRLINEKSPYLLQHAHNPVDWFPWGDEAFEKAKRENKPVLVSIGYSTTCHWWPGIIKSCGTPLKDNRSHFKR